MCKLKRASILLVCISEVKLTVASFLSDRIVDEILDALSRCHHKLVSAEHMLRPSESAMLRDNNVPSGEACFVVMFHSFAAL